VLNNRHCDAKQKYSARRFVLKFGDFVSAESGQFSLLDPVGRQPRCLQRRDFIAALGGPPPWTLAANRRIRI
jgi:hypothetical protein